MDIDTTPPATHCEGKPAMQLDLPAADQVMMEVDPDVNLRSSAVPQSMEPVQLATPSSTPTFNPHSTSPSHSSPNSKPFESTSPALSPLPSPPVVLISSSDVSAWPKFKLDQLFVEWLSRPESKSWLNNLVEEARSGKLSAAVLQDQDTRVRMDRSLSPGTRSPNSSQTALGVPSQQAPSSPVSRLFSKHIPFGDADSSPRSPRLTPNASANQQLSVPPMVGDLDLGKSGSASPMLSHQAAISKDQASSIRPSHQGPGIPTTEGIVSQPEVAISAQIEKTTATKEASKLEPQQVSDSRALDKVADGIAGMSAVLEQGRPSMDSEAKMSVAEESSKPENIANRPAVSQTDTISILSPGSEKVAKPQSEISSQMKHDERGEGSVPEQSHAISAVQLSERPNKADEPQRSTSPLGQGTGEDIFGRTAVDEPRQQVVAPRLTNSQLLDAAPQLPDVGKSKLISSAIPPALPKPSTPEDATMVDTSSRPAKRKALPRFYFPCGREAAAREEKECETMKEFFENIRTQKQTPGVNRTDIAELVVDVIGLPSYFASIVFSVIQETYGASQLLENGKQLPQDTSHGGLKPEASEVMMKDVSKKEELGASHVRSEDTAKVAGGNQFGCQASKADTTMGDVQTSETLDKHANGFRTDIADQQTSSAHGTQNPAIAPNGPNPLSTNSSREFVTEEQFTAFYKAKCSGFSKEARLFNALLEPGAMRQYLIPSDFKQLLRALLLCHQGLAFLQATPEFQQRYSETVIERIYFGCTRQHNGRLTLQDIKRSKLLDTFMVVDEEEDINRERKYFSYEHFYVLYCRFWELDANHDLQIDREDLMRYGSHSLTYRIVDRIFGGYARPLDTPENPGYMSYTDFIWFCLSEEDKTSETAIDYWFRCIDMDGDGLITMYDMEFFYKEQLHRMECFGHEPVQIRDILCQLLDMINPNVQPPVIRRRDLKRCRLAGNFFNVLFNLNKFFAIEARDPLQIRQEHATPELTEWDRFAALEYLRLSAEEEGEEDESWEDVGDSANPLMAGEAPF